MTFQPLNISSDATKMMNCRELQALNVWLNLPDGYTICPFFSSTVRDTVTPFMVFALGITVIGWFINRKEID
jgi:hypothetical protein